MSVDHFNPHGALKPQKTVFLNADLTLWLISTTFRENNHSKETPSWAPACNGKRGNLPSRGKWKCWRVQKLLILITKWWLDGSAKCNGWMVPYVGTVLQYLIFKICFRLLGFRPRPPPEFHSWTPCSATPTFLSTPPWGICCGRPGLVNILSFSYKFILFGRFSKKSFVRFWIYASKLTKFYPSPSI